MKAKAKLRNIAATTLLTAMAMGAAVTPALAAGTLKDITFNVYTDANGNGIHDAGETAPSDITYTLSMSEGGESKLKEVASGSANEDGTIHLQNIENGVNAFLTITSGGKSYTYQIDLLHMANRDYPVTVDVAWSPDSATASSEFVDFTAIFVEDSDFTSNRSQGDKPAAGRSITLSQGDISETVTTDAEGRATVSGKFKSGDFVKIKDNGEGGAPEFSTYVRSGISNFEYTILVPKKREVPEEKGIRLGLQVFEDTDGDGVISAGDKNVTNERHIIANQNGEDHMFFLSTDGPTSWFKELQPGEVVLTDHPTGTATSVIIPDGVKEFTVNMLIPKKETVKYNGNSSVDVNTTMNFREDTDGDGIISPDDKPLVGHEIKVDYTGTENGTVTKTTDDKGTINITEHVYIGSRLVVTDLTTGKKWNARVPGTVANYKFDVLEPAAKTNKPDTGKDTTKPAEARKVTTKIVVLEDTDKSGNVTEKDKVLGGRSLKLTIDGKQKDVVTGEDGSITIDDGIKAGDAVAITDTVSGASWKMRVPKNVTAYTFKALVSPTDPSPSDKPKPPSVHDIPVKTTIHIIHDTDSSGNITTGDSSFPDEEVKITVDGVERSYKTDIGGAIRDEFKQEQKITVTHVQSGRSWNVEVPYGVESFNFNALVPAKDSSDAQDSQSGNDTQAPSDTSNSNNTSNGTDTSNGNSATGASTGEQGTSGQANNEKANSLAHTGTNAASVGAVLAITLTAAGATIAMKRRKAS